LDSGQKQALTSYLTLLEVLVKPLEHQRRDLVTRYRATLLDSQSLRLVSLDDTIAEEAARIRAQYGFRTPDAIHLATAVLAEPDIFLTNDVRLRRFQEIPMVVLSDHLGQP
jgi:predicted nucleic acid-binding protein